ncbi:hypothetical protein [Pseudomonas sp. NPDC090208]|uniref:hypothetical protein n=1 Tax=Pseudomonas sp. NPDC090208 TaxID=3364478 RepID=UPI0037F34E10
MKLSDLAAQHMAELPIGLVLTDEQVLRSLRDATRFYSGYADLESGQEISASALGDGETDQDIDLTHSELSQIRPLWLLYMERENSTALEASRTMGADPYGRSVAEVQAAIADYERELPRQAFSFDFVSI